MDERPDHFMEYLRKIPEDSFWYLASPYSGFRGDLWTANRQVCKTAGFLAQERIPAFSPIAHSHALCMHYPVSATDHGLWMGLDKPMMRSAYGLIVVTMKGWKDSKGVAEEIDYFMSVAKPIVYMPPMEGL